MTGLAEIKQRIEDAAQAGSRAGQDRQHQTARTDDAAVDPGQAVLHAVIVDQVARAEVVGAVQDQIATARQLLDVLGVA